MLTREHGSCHQRGEGTDKQRGNCREVTPQSFVSDFSGGEKGSGQRPVVDLKCLNHYVKTEHFKMEDLHLLPDLLQAQEWMVKLDLKDAYL